MTINQFNSGVDRPNTSRMSILGIIFFIMGAPNLYAFMQRRSELSAVTYNGSGVPRYALVVLLAMAIAGIVELSVV
ncbi:hypothetical protein PN498_05565 [Oscillatoria sp. CS-180]|uniref:hypothetical protein n=1 Tax=Oscillatoria sp. CS-180 TaxID=3021720 RepID=UPI00232AF7AA|nr:hypothetical protein [Oscillatoria sp. CS-180]MDB9525446.1 hypothetical protein [Oscillatoria sp. CS-180]